MYIEHSEHRVRYQQTALLVRLGLRARFAASVDGAVVGEIEARGTIYWKGAYRTPYGGPTGCPA
jgi:hypothetical protein